MDIVAVRGSDGSCQIMGGTVLLARIPVVVLTVGVMLAGAAAAADAQTQIHSGVAKSAVSARTPSHFDDGSFETPEVAPYTFQTFTAGSSIGPWQVVGGTVDLIGAGFWQAAEGDQSVDLDGYNTGSVAQTFSTVRGTRYTVTYSLAGNPASGPVVKTGRVLIDGQVFQNFSFDVTNTTQANMGYVTREVNFVANNPATTLTFASTTPGAYGPVIDDVLVQPCPPCPCR